ncbi:unnamed protein product [Callosobruchus maculatus]|uniref:Zinc finger CCCH domain-containing protein 3 n=1 Tax=Callosobruchus maculatus TaxID=64391 RepID=A0A653DE61_CALMS|nr:unnamed protein product [Callosobruchus maculatus]
MENFEGLNFPSSVSAHINPAFLQKMHHSTNSTANVPKRYVYVNQHMVHQQHVTSKVLVNSNTKSKASINPNAKVLINPRFAAKVYVNPNFQSTIGCTDAPNSKIHVNPNVLRNIPVSIHDQTRIQEGIDIKGVKSSTYMGLNLKAEQPKSLSNTLLGSADNQVYQHKSVDNVKETKVYPLGDHIRKSKSIYSIRNIPKLAQNTPHLSGLGVSTVKERKTSYRSRTKIVHTPVKQVTPKKRRSSVRSQFKIVKSTARNKLLKKSPSNTSINVFLKTKHKIIKFQKNGHKKLNSDNTQGNKFKLDNRQRKSSSTSPKVKKFVYLNQFTTANELARAIPSKPSRNLSMVNIQGILYKKSSHSLHRANSSIHKIRKGSLSKIPGNSKYKFVKKPSSSKSSETSNCRNSMKQSSTSGSKRKQTDKLRKCNIPCPYYRKFGRCKGKDNGKCFRKHDPDQIALCTKFLQGACINQKCLLSHNVSPEKMPTCKFYLEGVCSKDNCPYLHVRLSPKADICRDFLEGFCRMGIKVRYTIYFTSYYTNILFLT